MPIIKSFRSDLISVLAQLVKNLPAMWETWVQFLGWEVPLEKEMAAHSGILAWRITCTEEPGGLQSMGSQRVISQWKPYGIKISVEKQDFPGGPVVENSPTNAGDVGRKTPHAEEQGSPQATLLSPRSSTRKATALRSSPCSAQLEKARTQPRRPSTDKK